MRGKSNIRVGIDLMGSDAPAAPLLEAVLALFQEQESGVEFILLGTAPVFERTSLPEGVTAHIVCDVIGMEEDPLHAVRRKKDSSLCTGVRLLREKEIDAFVTAGNTGALIASAGMSLSTLPGIDRPALLTLLPTRQNEIAVLDVGAGVSCKSDHLIQFASMGIAYQKCRGIANPTVGLLNIGSEEKKGTPEHREAYQKLQTLGTFVGNVEGRDVFQGGIDVLVTDGFTGNVFLKTAEGIASVILDELQEHTAEECSPQLKTVLATLRHRLHYAEYPGAILCGIEGVVVKCHGDGKPEALVNSVKGAMRLVQHSFLERIKHQLSAV
jgi:glycerol-3-phosphate acyltransferase PlsX